MSADWTQLDEVMRQNHLDNLSSMKRLTQDLLDHGIDIRPRLLYLSDQERREFEAMKPERAK